MRTYSSIILAALVIGPGTALSKKLEEGERFQSCLKTGTASPALLQLGSSPFEKEEMKVVEGFYGPELQIGDVRVFLNPNSVKTKDKDGKENINNSWCIIDPAANLKNKKDKNEANCGGDLHADESSAQDKNRKPMVITTKNGSYKIEPKFNKENKSIDLFFDSSSKNYGGRNSKNRLVLTGFAEESKSKTTISSLRVESRGLTNGAVNGVVESQVEGKFAESSDSNDKNKDVNSSMRFSQCLSQNEAKGQLRKSEDAAPTTAVDISGAHIVMRGSEKYGIDQYEKSEDSSRGAKPKYMTDTAGRN